MVIQKKTKSISTCLFLFSCSNLFLLELKEGPEREAADTQAYVTFCQCTGGTLSYSEHSVDEFTQTCLLVP